MKKTFNKKTVVTLDAWLDGEDLEWTLNESVGDSDDTVTLESGNVTFRIARADLVALVDHVGRPTPPTQPNVRQLVPKMQQVERSFDSGGTPLYTNHLTVIAE